MMKKFFVNEYVFAVFSKLIMIFTGIFSTVLINRYLGPALKGEYTYLLNLINFIAIFSNLGIYQAYPYYKKKSVANIRIDFLNIIYLQLVIYMIVAITLVIILQGINYLIAILIVPIMTLNNQIAFMALVDSPNKRNKIVLINEVVYTVLLGIIYFMTHSNMILLLVLLLAKELLKIVALSKGFSYKPNFKGYTFKLVLKAFYRYVSFGFFPMISLFLLSLNYRADIFILAIFLQPKSIGLYSVGVTLSEKALFITDAIKEVLFSKTSKNESVKEILLLTKLSIYFYLFLFIVMLLIGKQIILILYGVEFIDSYQVTAIIFMGNIGMAIFKMIYTSFISEGKTKISFVLLTICVSVNIAMNILLIPRMGINGSAFASVLSYNLCGIAFYLYFIKLYKIKYFEIIWLNQSEISLIAHKIGRKNKQSVKEISCFESREDTANEKNRNINFSQKY